MYKSVILFLMNLFSCMKFFHYILNYLLKVDPKQLSNIDDKIIKKMNGFNRLFFDLISLCKI